MYTIYFEDRSGNFVKACHNVKKIELNQDDGYYLLIKEGKPNTIVNIDIWTICDFEKEGE